MKDIMTSGIWLPVEEYDRLRGCELKLELLRRAQKESLLDSDFASLAKAFFAADESPRG